MPAISFGGLTSGLDTAAIVDQLMAVERNPQVLLQNKLAKQNQQVAALQGINTRLASLATAATALAKPETFTRTAATSTDTSVTVVSRPEATDASLSFTVRQVAARDAYASAPVKDGALGPQKIIVTGANGVPVLVTATGGSIPELAKAINAANNGVRATAVRTGDGEYRLLISSTDTGAKNKIEVTSQNTDPADTKAPLKFTQTSVAKDAQIDLGKSQIVSSASNTFTDLMTGVDVTVTKASDAGAVPITVSSKPDEAAVAKQAAGLVGALNVALSEMADQSKADVTTPGALSGSSLVRGIQQQLASAMSTAVPGATLADVGIQLTRDGAVTIDEGTFASFLRSNPDQAKAVTTAFATAVAGVATQASASGTGSISQAVTSAQSTVKDLGDRIDDFDTRLELRRTTLERQFTALDVAISASKNQQTWLAGQISGLPSYS